MTHRRLTLGLHLAMLVLVAPAAQGALSGYKTRAIPSANGEYLLVLLTPQGEREGRLEQSLAEQDRLEELYPKSGLYRNDGSTKLLWPVEYLSIAKDIYVSDDGIHLVAAFLDWGGGTSDRGYAVEFYANGRLLAAHNEPQLLDGYLTRRVISNLLDIAPPVGTAAVLNNGAKTFELKTNWGDAFRFDITTGELVDSSGPWGAIMIALLTAICVPPVWWLLWRRGKRNVPA